MNTDPFTFNGIDATTGAYLTPALPPEDVVRLAQGVPLDPNHLAELRARHYRDTEKTFAPVAGVEVKDLASAGWGVVFAHNTPPSIKDSLRVLLDHRKAQAARKKEHYYKEYAADKAYRAGDPNETKRTFLARNGAAAGMPADPDKVPYYLLLVGDPESIPYSFQYQLDVEYAVGRLWFEKGGKPDLEAFACYARSVVEAETGPVALPRRAAFFGVQNEDDGATNLSAVHLVQPLAGQLGQQFQDWTIQTSLNEKCRKADLAALLNGPEVPALLFTASHGMGFPDGHPDQLEQQGALLCQDWPGPTIAAGRPIPADYFLAGDDVAGSAQLLGLIAFHFACYGAGTPRLDDFAHLRQLSRPGAIAPRAFVARLPQRLLGHPRGGALAVVGHVERAWSCSFHGGPTLGEQLQAFQSTLVQLLQGYPVGAAMEFFNQLYAALSAELSKELEDVKYGKVADNWALSSMWTSNNDARSYLVLGDPAVRLPLATDNDPPRPRPVLPAVVTPDPVTDPAPTRPAPATPPQTPEGTPMPDKTQERMRDNAGVFSPAAESVTAATVLGGSEVTLTVPLQITLRFGTPAAVPVSAAVAAAPLPESVAFAVPVIDPQYGNREGYDPEFLGDGAQALPLPKLTRAQEAEAARVRDAERGDNPYELKYHHFSVVLHGKRRLAFFTAVNIDGRFARSIERATDKWYYDPRVGQEAQVGNELYKGTMFDRGHLVRRLDPAWGRTTHVAKVANDDTFHFTNCSPQHKRFNEGKNLWAGLEDYLLHKATGERKRLTVFTGPVLRPDDPAFRGVPIPKQFWKVAVVARPNGRLASLGFVVSQEALLREVVSFGPTEVATTFQVPVRHVEQLTGFDFGPLRTLDAGAVVDFAPGAPEARELTSLDDIRIPV
jgi:DNA/RNA endonuclease G (NUC1)